MKIIITFCLLLFAATFSQAQNPSDIIEYGSADAIAEKIYHFNRDQVPDSVRREYLSRILPLMLNDSSLSLYLFTNSDTTSDVDHFLTSDHPHIKEFLSHIYYLDVNGDRNQDVIYQMQNPRYERQMIRIYVNKGSSFKNITVPGDFITEVSFSNAILKSVKTMEIGCCDFFYDLYRKIDFTGFDSDSLSIAHCAAIPKGTKAIDISRSTEFEIIADSVFLRNRKDEVMIDRNSVFVKKKQYGIILSDAKQDEVLVNLSCNREMGGAQVTNVWGWIDRESIRIKKKIKVKGKDIVRYLW